MNRNQEFLDREGPIYMRMLECLRLLTPRGWRRAILELEASYDPIWKTRSMKHRFVNPHSGVELKDLPAELFEVTTELHAVYTEFDQVWRRCRVELRFAGPRRLEGSRTTFDYGMGLPEGGAVPRGTS
jgi:hypothetical protein